MKARDRAVICCWPSILCELYESIYENYPLSVARGNASCHFKKKKGEVIKSLQNKIGVSPHPLSTPTQVLLSPLGTSGISTSLLSGSESAHKSSIKLNEGEGKEESSFVLRKSWKQWISRMPIVSKVSIPMGSQLFGCLSSSFLTYCYLQGLSHRYSCHSSHQG